MADYQLTESGETVIRTADRATIPSDPANRDWRDYQDWLAAGGVPDPFVLPPPGLYVQPPTLVAAALDMRIADSDIAMIGGVFNIVGAVYLGPGMYLLAFTEPQPDDAYFAVITGDPPSKAITERATDYFIIETKDAVGGNYIDADQLTVQIYRV